MDPWYKSKNKSKYLVANDLELRPTQTQNEPRTFVDVNDGALSSSFMFDRTIDKSLEKTLQKVDEGLETWYSDDSGNSDISIRSTESYHFGGKQEDDFSDEDHPIDLLSSIHLDATFITEPETIPLPASVEIQLVQLMKRVVKLEKKNKRSKLVSTKLKEQVTSLAAELEKKEIQAMEAEAMMNAQNNDASQLMKGVSSGNLNKDRKKQEEETRRKKERKKLFAGLVDDDNDADDDDQFDLGNPLGIISLSLKHLKRCWKRNIPFRSDLRIIESRYGGSTASFFIFFRWLFVNNLAVMLLHSIFFFLHISSIMTKGHAPNRVSMDTNLKTEWVTPDKIAWYRTEGGIPAWASFSAYSSNLSDAINIPLLYSSLLILVQIVLLSCTAKRWVGENKKQKRREAFEGKESKRWSKFLFTAYDHNVHGNTNVIEDQLSAASETLTVMHIEDNSAAAASNRSTLAWFILYVRRFVVASIYIFIQLSGWYAILYLTIDGDVFKESIAASLSLQSSDDLYVDPAAISVSIINAVNNIICKQLVKNCKFDDTGTEIKVYIGMLFLSRTFNIGIQLGAYAQLVSPMLFLRTKLDKNGDLMVMKYFGISGLTIRKTSKQFDSTGFSCRANQFGNQFFSLMVTEFAMGKILGIAIPGIKFLIAKIRRKKFVKSQFVIETKLVALLFFQQLSLISLPLLPISSIFSLLFLLLNFKWDVYILLLTQKKPKKPWSAKDAGAYYLRLYVLSLILITGAVHVLMSSTTLPKLCSIQTSTLPTESADTIVQSFQLQEYAVQTFSAPPDCNLKEFKNSSTKNLTAATYCSCNYACGPFIKSQNAYSPIVEFVKTNAIPTTIYSMLNSIQLWVAIGTLLMISRWNLMNSIAVDQNVMIEKEHASKQARDLQAREIKHLHRKLALQKQMNNDE